MPAKKATRKAARKTPVSPKKAATPARRGRPGRADKAEGDAPVRAYIAGLPPAHREIARRVDALVARVVPDLRRAIKWGTPIYGVEGRGWFCSFAAFTNHCAVRFFRGADLVPEPPEGTSELMRSINLRDASDVDDAQLADWVRQAAALPGWGS